MPWSTPTLKEVRALNRDNITAYLPGAESTTPNAALRVLSDQNAAGAHLNLLYLDYLAQQFLPDTAENEWLERHGQIWVGGRQAATFAAGSIYVTGLDGTVLPLGSQVATAGLAFETTEAVTVGPGQTPVAVRALTAGIASNLAPGTNLALSIAVAGVDAGATVVRLTGGVDVESYDSLRERVLARIRKPPMGGAADDYVAWAREVPGVTRAWCSPAEMGPGSVTVRFMMDDLRADLDGYPTIGDVAVVQTYIDDRRPVTVQDCFVSGPVPEPIDFTITNLTRDSAATRAAIAASVRALIRDRAAPARAVNGSRVAAQTIYREWVSAAILSASGVERFDLTMDDHAMPYNGALAELGTITYA